MRSSSRSDIRAWDPSRRRTASWAKAVRAVSGDGRGVWPAGGSGSCSERGCGYEDRRSAPTRDEERYLDGVGRAQPLPGRAHCRVVAARATRKRMHKREEKETGGDERFT
ncbi:MAG: hypothetical protein INR71_07035 [Terriglobus roseus]|nr:hypothetical protein [Terriglobus roseus]